MSSTTHACCTTDPLFVFFACFLETATNFGSILDDTFVESTTLAIEVLNSFSNLLFIGCLNAATLTHQTSGFQVVDKRCGTTCATNDQTRGKEEEEEDARMYVSENVNL